MLRDLNFLTSRAASQRREFRAPDRIAFLTSWLAETPASAMTYISPADLFILPERMTVLVRLPSFEWDFSLGLAVCLRSEGHSVHATQIGTGNHEGRATILLSPRGDWTEAEEELQAIVKAERQVVLELDVGPR